MPVGHGLGQVLVGGQDHPRIDVEGLGAADLLELEVLQHAEQLDLHAGAGGADFVEEDRAAVGLHELAQLVADGAGEGPGHVAEQLAFQQRFGQRPAGDFDERLVAAAAAAMDGPGDQRLARAALAGDQHGGLGVGDRVDHVEDPQHAVVVADDVLHAEPQVELGLQRLVFLDHLRWFRARSMASSSSSSISGLVRKSKAPARIASTADLHRAVAGDQDHRRVGTMLAAMGQQVEAVAVAQPDIGQDQIVRLCVDGRHGLGGTSPPSSTA